jgi:predicted metal-binding membrane protein
MMSTNSAECCYRGMQEPAISSRGTQSSDPIFLGAAALLFAASAIATVIDCTAMPAMEMPGGWNMSMAWMRMPGQGWFGAAAAFLGMWMTMMAAMMLPSLIPMLWRYRQALAEASRLRMNGLTALAAMAYFFIWAVFGALIFPLGAMFAELAMEHPALACSMPIALGVVVLMAGVMQFTAWKTRHLACCRDRPRRGRNMPADTTTAWRHGLGLGVHCGCSSAGFTAILLAGGVMDLRLMAAVTVAITVERLVPDGERVARGIGVVATGAGVFLLVRAMVG